MSTQEAQNERLDRELLELLNELRVFMPGVQVLLGFLLMAPFNQRFQQLAPSLKEVYFAAVLFRSSAARWWSWWSSWSSWSWWWPGGSRRWSPARSRWSGAGQPTPPAAPCCPPAGNRRPGTG